jgi:hypothetical protein
MPREQTVLFMCTLFQQSPLWYHYHNHSHFPLNWMVCNERAFLYKIKHSIYYLYYSSRLSDYISCPNHNHSKSLLSYFHMHTINFSIVWHWEWHNSLPLVTIGFWRWCITHRDIGLSDDGQSPKAQYLFTFGISAPVWNLDWKHRNYWESMASTRFC